MQETITWICVDQDRRHYIAWLGHNEFRPTADFRIVLGSLAGLLVVDLVSLHPPFQFLKQKFSLSCPKKLFIYSICHKFACSGANFTGKAPKLKFYSAGVTGQPLILHTSHTSSYVFLVL